MIDDIIRLSINHRFVQRQDGVLDQAGYLIALSRRSGLTQVSDILTSMIDIDEKVILKEECCITDSKKSVALIEDIKALIDSRGGFFLKGFGVNDVRRFSNALGCYDAADIIC